MNRPLFPTTLSILSYDIGEVARAKDLSVPTRALNWKLVGEGEPHLIKLYFVYLSLVQDTSLT